MKIIEKIGIEAAKDCAGSVVVIDVLRAFTTAAFAFAQGVEEIFLVATVDEAFELKKRNPRFILVGENDGRKIQNFDYGNSPQVISEIDLRGQNLILRSSSGTQGVAQAKSADSILLGSLPVASSTVRLLQEQSPSIVSLLSLGTPSGKDFEEDQACSSYLKSLLLGEDTIKQDIVNQVWNGPAGRRARDPQLDWISEADLECAVSIDKFSFAMPVSREGRYFIGRKTEI